MSQSIPNFLIFPGSEAKLLKALYGTIKVALMFYKKLMGNLKKKGFVRNPYDPCVANKMVNGKQLTLV